MTATSKPSRADLVRQRRAGKKPAASSIPQVDSTARKTYRPESIFLPVTPRPAARKGYGKFGSTAQGSAVSRTLRQSQGTASSPYARSSRRSGNDYSFSLGRADVRAPSLSIPQLGSRWISLVGSALLVFLLYTMWTSSAFTVASATVHGNERLGAADINSVLGMVGEPIFKAVPANLVNNLHAAFPDLASVRVSVGFPNHINITVVERTPVLAWYQNDSVTWIDGNGVAFRPRGQVNGLIQVSANGTPPKVETDPSTPLYAMPYIDPAMVKAMVTLSPYVPSGAPMVYDPKYGMGWQDPRGWSVYFGGNTQDIPMKLVVYKAIVDAFTKQGIQPTMVSMEYLDAPFYK